MSQTAFVPYETFSQYSDRLKEHFVMSRNEGIIEVRFHTKGKVALWSLELHKALPQMFQAVGQDPDNEVMIFTGSGNAWIGQADSESFAAQQKDADTFRATSYDLWYLDAVRLVEQFLWSIDIPVISAINGSGFHTETALMSDLTIATNDTVFFEPHFGVGLVPGDAQFLVLQELIGLKRAAHAMYLCESGISAQQALDWGMVGELCSRENLLPRARELAGVIMRQPRIVRRLTSQLVRRPWRKIVNSDLTMQIAHEMYSATVAVPDTRNVKVD